MANVKRIFQGPECLSITDDGKYSFTMMMPICLRILLSRIVEGCGKRPLVDWTLKMVLFPATHHSWCENLYSGCLRVWCREGGGEFSQGGDATWSQIKWLPRGEIVIRWGGRRFVDEKMCIKETLNPISPAPFFFYTHHLPFSFTFNISNRHTAQLSRFSFPVGISLISHHAYHFRLSCQSCHGNRQPASPAGQYSKVLCGDACMLQRCHGTP